MAVGVRHDVPRFTSGPVARDDHRRPLLAVTVVLLGLLALIGSLATSPRLALAADASVVETLHLEGEVNAVSADYLSTALSNSGRSRATAVVLLIDTPGGISTAMDRMVTALLNAPVPVAAYVAPSGARAASAGLFVAQAADVVAMAPGTNIGSAHPVTGSGGDIGGDLGRKVLNDAVARIRSLASLHHRNADWCEQAVRNSVNIDADAAKALGVADLEPPTMDSLLSALDGRAAPRPGGSALTFRTAGATVVDEPMSVFQSLLLLLVDPNVAYILLLIAVFGLIAEVTSPGAILPGVVGGLAAILALVALSTLPVNLAGALLMAFAFLLFVADIKAQTHGILTAGGLISLLLGSAFLLNTGAVDLGIDWRLIVVAAAAAAAGFAFVVRKAVRARSGSSAPAASALVGSLGEARGPLSPTGQVWVAGAVWPASSTSGSIASGQSVRVTAQDRTGLRVEPVAPPENGKSVPGTGL
jgi:membrane-bound serine protease (ClpP class)